jgi:outer membrane protein assembly factor BamB
MRQDFVTRLELELRAAADRQARAAWRPHVRLRWLAPALAVAAVAALAVVLLRPAPEREEAVPAQQQPRLVAQEQLASRGGPVIAASGAAWVSDPATGDVLRVDPRTRKVVARIPVGSGAALSPGAGDTLWALSFGRLNEIDAGANRVVRRIPVSSRFQNVALAGGALWLAGPDAAARVDVARGTVGRSIPTVHKSFQPVGANTDGRTIYVLRADGTLLRIDARTGRRLPPVTAQAAGPIDAISGGRLYVALDNAEVALDARTGRILWERELGSQSVNAAAADGATLWVHATDRATHRDRLWRLDARTGHVIGALTLPAFGAAGMTTVGGQAWVISLEGELMEAR